MDRKFSDIADSPLITRELNAMAILNEMMELLLPDERRRVLAYLSDRFSEPLEEGK